jgi:hypothetical protein
MKEHPTCQAISLVDLGVYWWWEVENVLMIKEKTTLTTDVPRSMMILIRMAFVSYPHVRVGM